MKIKTLLFTMTFLFSVSGHSSFFEYDDDDKLKDATKSIQKATKAFKLKDIYSGCMYIRRAMDDIYDIDLDERRYRKVKNEIEALANNTQLICKGY